MNIPKISFGSTYIVKRKENTLNNYCKVHDLDTPDGKLTIYSQKNYTDNAQRNIVVDDTRDFIIENFLKQNNIKFHKKTNEELTSQYSILKRVRVPNDKYPKPRYLPFPVYVKADKFDELFKESFQYVGDYDSMEWKSKSRYDGFKEYIKSDMPIDLPEVYVSDRNYTPEICFQDGRHRYAVMRDMGFKSIPVAMNDESFELAKVIGLIDKIGTSY